MGAFENMYAKNMINIHDSNLHRRGADTHYNLEDNFTQHRYKLTYFGAQD